MNNPISLRNVNAVLLDWDGTVVDSMPRQYEKIRALFERYQVEPPSLEAFCRTLRAPFEEFYPKYGLNAPYSDLMDFFFGAYTKDDAAPVYPDFKPFLERALGARLRVGVVSAGKTDRLHHNAERLGLPFSKEDLIGDKPDKIEAIRDLCARYEVSPERTVYVGDLGSDVLHGQAAGTLTAAYLGDHGHPSSFTNPAPDFIVKNFTELGALLGI